jgi:hypothetical protein
MHPASPRPQSPKPLSLPDAAADDDIFLYALDAILLDGGQPGAGDLLQLTDIFVQPLVATPSWWPTPAHGLRITTPRSWRPNWRWCSPANGHRRFYAGAQRHWWSLAVDADAGCAGVLTCVRLADLAQGREITQSSGPLRHSNGETIRKRTFNRLQHYNHDRANCPCRPCPGVHAHDGRYVAKFLPVSTWIGRRVQRIIQAGNTARPSLHASTAIATGITSTSTPTSLQLVERVSFYSSRPAGHRKTQIETAAWIWGSFFKGGLETRWQAFGAVS